MENNIDEIQEIELLEETNDNMGPTERDDNFGVPAEDIELEEYKEEV